MHRDDSLVAPLRHRAFRWLWVGVVAFSIGFWAQTVGAQWLFVNDPNAATIVSLVQSASALPIMLLALPGGVLADAFDRRWLLLGVTTYFIIVSGLLAWLTYAELMGPILLLGFTFAIGCGMALQIPTWQPLMTELVPRSQIAAATRLDMINVNAARAIGPAIAGFIIATWGVAPVFAFNALCVLVLVGALVAWRRPKRAPDRPESFMPALRAGGRYVRHEPVVRRILLRLAIFVAPATAMWALLPIIANHQLGLDARGYGLLFGAIGVGAVLGALLLGHLRRRMSANAVLTLAAVAYGVSLALVMIAPGLAGALPLLVIVGFAWTGTASTLISELQLFLPSWVRARALAVYTMVFTGTQALVSPLWGVTAQFAGVVLAVELASLLVIASGLAGLAWRLPSAEGHDPAPLIFWPDATLELDPDPTTGPVLVEVQYRVPPENEDAFAAAMVDLRRSRLRTGANRWEYYRTGEDPEVFVEVFATATWEEHVRQHEGRLTAADKDAEELAASLTSEPPTSRHMLPPGTPVHEDDEPDQP